MARASNPAAAALATLPAPGAAWMAVTLGTAIEQGGDVNQTGPAVLSLLFSWLSTVAPTRAPEHQGEGGPVRLDLPRDFLEAFNLLCQATVAHVARMPARRAELSEDGERLDQRRRGA